MPATHWQIKQNPHYRGKPITSRERYAALAVGEVGHGRFEDRKFK
jgi:hypothetical protein